MLNNSLANIPTVFRTRLAMRISETLWTFLFQNFLVFTQNLYKKGELLKEKYIQYAHSSPYALVIRSIFNKKVLKLNIIQLIIEI